MIQTHKRLKTTTIKTLIYHGTDTQSAYDTGTQPACDTGTQSDEALYTYLH